MVGTSGPGPAGLDRAGRRPVVHSPRTAATLMAMAGLTRGRLCPAARRGGAGCAGWRGKHPSSAGPGSHRSRHPPTNRHRDHTTPRSQRAAEPSRSATSITLCDRSWVFIAVTTTTTTITPFEQPWLTACNASGIAGDSSSKAELRWAIGFGLHRGRGSRCGTGREHVREQRYRPGGISRPAPRALRPWQ
jgi:hypothetical protein